MQQSPRETLPTPNLLAKGSRLPDPLHIPRVLPKVQPPASPFLATFADETLSPAPLARNAWPGSLPDLPSFQPMPNSTMDPRDLHLDYLTPRSRSLSMATTFTECPNTDWATGSAKALGSSPSSSTLSPSGVGELRRARRQSRRQLSLEGESGSIEGPYGRSEKMERIPALPPLPPLSSLTKPASGRLVASETPPWSIPSTSDRFFSQRRASPMPASYDSLSPYNPGGTSLSPIAVPASGPSRAAIHSASIAANTASPTSSSSSRFLQRRKSQLDLVAAAMADQEARRGRPATPDAASRAMSSPSGTGDRGTGRRDGSRRKSGAEE